MKCASNPMPEFFELSTQDAFSAFGKIDARFYIVISRCFAKA